MFPPLLATAEPIEQKGWKVWRWLFLVSALFLLAIYSYALALPAAGVYHDDGIYITTAKSLAEGNGYLIEGLPQAIPQTKYPILFPALLALVWKLAPHFPENVTWLKLVPFFAALLWYGLSWKFLLWTTRDRVFSSLTVLAVAATPLAIFLSVTVLSETVFAVLLTGSLYLLSKDEAKRNACQLIAAAVLAAASYHTRTLGICVVGAGVVSLLLRRRWRDALLFSAVAGGLMLPWIIWQMIAKADASYYSSASYYGHYNILFSYNWTEKWLVLRTNLVSMSLTVWLTWLAQYPNIFPWVFPLSVPFTAIVAASVMRVPGLLTVRLFVTFYEGILLLWLGAPFRFNIPVMPLLILLVWRWLPAGMARKCFYGLLCLAILWGGGFCLVLTKQAEEIGTFYHVRAIDNWYEMHRQFLWLKNNTPATAVIQGNLNPAIYLYTGRQATRGAEIHPLPLYYDFRKGGFFGKPSDFIRRLIREKVTHVVRVPNTYFWENAAFDDFNSRMQRAYPGALRRVYESGKGEYVIYEFHPEFISDLR